LNANTSMLQYYSSIVEVQTKSNIYTNSIDDRCRSVITRWRLSNHKLFIETGRYHSPKIEREDRKCVECNVLEDEGHAIYFCPAYAFIRRKYERLLGKYTTVRLILDPEPIDIYEVSNLLSEIDGVLNNR